MKKKSAKWNIRVMMILEEINKTGLLPLPTSRAKRKAIEIYKAKKL